MASTSADRARSSIEAWTFAGIALTVARLIVVALALPREECGACTESGSQLAALGGLVLSV
jgi:hypothetical protein